MALRAVVLATALALTGLPAAKLKPAPADAAALPQPADVPPLLIATGKHPPDPAKRRPGDVGREACIPVDVVEVRGVSLIDREALKAALTPLADRCLGNSVANAILATISEQHAARGYATTQGFIPTGQDIKASRRLVINVITGRVGAIHYHEIQADMGFAEAYGRMAQAPTPWAFLLAASALVDGLDDPLDRFQLIDGMDFPSVKRWLAMSVGQSDPLRIDLVQQGLDQMNKAPSSHADAKLEPGSDPGTSDIEIDNPVEDSFRLFAGYEINGGSINGLPGTLPQRLRIDAAKDNLIGVNDSWAASIASGLDAKEARASLVVPLRWWTFSVNQGYSESLQAIGETAYLFSRTYTSVVGDSYLAWRVDDLQVSTDSSLSFRSNERWIDSVRLTPQRVPAARLGISGAKLMDNQQLTFSAGLGRGLRWFDASIDPDDAISSAPRAQYWKLDGSLSYTRDLPDIGVVKADLFGQWTDHPLYLDDELTLGSPSSVRGFTNQPASVDSGVVLRSEFMPAIPYARLLGPPAGEAASGRDSTLRPSGKDKPDPGFIADVLPPLQPYIFADLGFGRNIANGENLARVGVGAGLRYGYGRLNVDFATAAPVYLRSSNDDGREFRRSPEFYLTLSAKLF